MSAIDRALQFLSFGAYVPDRQVDPEKSYGSPAGGASPPAQPLDMTAVNQQQDMLSGQLDAARRNVSGAYDQAVQAQNQRRADALKVLMGNMGAVGAATAASSGVQGLLGSGASQASGRQTALQAAQAANQMLGQSAVDTGNVLRQKAMAELGFAQRDVQTGAANMQAIVNDIEALKNTSGISAEAYRDELMRRASRYPEGSVERNLYMSEATLVGQSGRLLIG
tara:strand:- start:7550 stop:8221 length:672 start_codon:yes stop_codon:yes gene_type:complete